MSRTTIIHNSFGEKMNIKWRLLNVRAFITLTASCLLAPQIASADITGSVFRDFNANGVKDNTATFNEIGIGGVTVNCTDAAGGSGSTSSSSALPTLGQYTLTGCNGASRVEFIWTTTGDYSGPTGSANNTSVQFITEPASGINFGINYPVDYSNPTNLKIFTPVYTNGDPLLGGNSGTQRGLISVDHSTGTTDPYTTVLDASEVGSAWGLAYHKSSKQLFVASFLKRHYGLGSGGLGQIYSVNTTTNAVSPFANLTTDYGIPVGSIDRTAEPLPADTSTANHDIDAFGKIGTVGIGGLDVSDDDRYLFVTNLFDQKIYALNITSTGVKPATANAITLSNTSCTGGVARPWALKFYRGSIYAGLVCTAETSESPADLYAKVLKIPFDTNTGTPGTETEVLSFPLRGTTLWGPNEIKGAVTSDFYTGVAPYDDPDWARWQNWAIDASDYDYFLNPADLGRSGALRYWAQPILSDLEFDTDGSMILGFMDRVGNQLGVRNYVPNATTVLKSGVAGGDIYRTCYNPATDTHTLESNGSLTGCGLTSGGGVNTHGPGGGEFYYQDGMPYMTNANHNEGAMGALALIPGYNEVISTQMGITWSATDTENYYTGGFNWYSNANGSRDRAYLVYLSDSGLGTPTPDFGKTNGLGDIEVVTDSAPLEIGNRVWLDSNSNGIQDADEVGVENITVELKSGGTTIATATTAADGTYYFSNAAGTSTTSKIYSINQLQPGTAYTIHFPTSVTVSATNYNLTTANAGSNTAIDSNALASGDVAVAATDIPLAGANNHSFDVGYQPAVVGCPTISVSPNPLANGTVGTVYTANPSANASDSGTYTYTWNATNMPSGLAVNSGTGVISGTPTATGSATITASASIAGQTCSGSTVLTVNSASSGCTTITNTVQVTNVNETDTNSANDSASTPLQVNCPTPQTDLKLLKTASKTVVHHGDTLTYTLTLSNESSVDATGVEVTDNLPTGVTLINATTTRGSYAAGIWNVGNVAASETVTLTIEVAVD